MRNAITALAGVRDHGQHPGLILQRFLAHPADRSEQWSAEKRAVLTAAAAAAGNPDLRDLYRRTFERWKTSLPELTVASDFLTAGRLIVGLGSENVLETGIRLHHTYGLPVIPGSALKGLAAHYCHQVWGQLSLGSAAPDQSKRFRRPTKDEDKACSKFLNNKGPRPDDNFFRLLFGNTDDSGCVTFHDAWLSPDSSNPLVMDVMTPHHPDWVDGTAPPTDFDNPTPIPFLSVSGKFRVAVSWTGPDSDKAKNWTELVFALLGQALKEWGSGGKTSSGYGRLIETTVTPTVAPPRPPGPTGKRDHGTPATVTILAARPGGFDVQEVGRPPGVLNQGKAPATLPEIQSTVEVYVYNDDPRKPQYRWDRPAAPPPPRRQGRNPRR
jgi:CRISPR-associated protein Cmr6